MNRTNWIEGIKNILLVVLFFLTILLLYFYWGNVSIQNLIDYERPTAYREIAFQELLKPSQISVSFGGETYTVIDDGFDVMMDNFRSFSKKENVSIGEIPELQYKEALKFPSVVVSFDYFVPFSAICEVYQIEKVSGSDMIDSLTQFGFSEASQNSLYFYDGKSKKYYRITGAESQKEPFKALSDMIRTTANQNPPTYYKLGSSYLGGNINNDTLFPYAMESDIRDFEYIQDFYAYQDEKIADMAKPFFSDNFDFVRKIEEENGTVIYMYGYGKLVLIADKSGTLEYKREEEVKSLRKPSYLEALGAAKDFIAAHGAFETNSAEQFEPYLKEATVDPGDKKDYRFVFGLRVNGKKLVYQGGEPITVDVSGDRVTYFKKDMIGYDPAELQHNAGSREVYPAIDMLAQNFEYIRGVIVDLDKGNDPLLAVMSFEALAEKVQSLDLGYVRLKNTDEAYIVDAAWIVNVGGIEFYFDLEDPVPLGYSVK